jgi:uncharacterized protein (TIGR03435 family)
MSSLLLTNLPYNASNPEIREWIESRGIGTKSIRIFRDEVSGVSPAEMTQNMLKDRFGLKTHWEKKEFPVYTLGLSKRVPELKEVTPPQSEVLFPMGNIRGMSSIVDWGSGSRFSFSDNTLDATKLNMNQFAEWLGNFMDKPLINNTGLTGHYDFSLKLSPQDFQTMFIWAAMAGGSELPPEVVRRMQHVDGLSLDSLMTALKQVGLKLDRGKGLVDVLSIDSVERKPTEN